MAQKVMLKEIKKEGTVRFEKVTALRLTPVFQNEPGDKRLLQFGAWKICKH
jgi:hypothetical protein